MPDDIAVVVLTGGPKAGKSTAINHLKAEHGSLVMVVEETATRLFVSGLNPPTTTNEKRMFQQIVLSYQQYNEQNLIATARRQGAKVVVLDRGVLDSAAYVDGGVDEVLGMIDRTKEHIYSGIDAVLHLESVAVFNPDLFDNEGNPHRVEGSAEEAQVLDQRTQEAWNDHPEWRLIPGRDGIDSVIGQVSTIIEELLFQEIERKWIIPSIPDSEILTQAVDVLEIEQYYTQRKGESETRYRLTVHQDRHREYAETMKFGAGLERREFDSRPIPEVAFYSFYPDDEREVIRKTRFQFADGGNSVLSLDVFHGRHQGHVTLEREFVWAKHAKGYILPSQWVQLGAREVTGDRSFSNARLASRD